MLAVSNYAASQAEKYLGVARNRLRVTLEGVSATYRPSERADDIAAAAARAGVPAGARWLIYVGGFGPHKHVDLIVRAHASVVRRSQQSVALVLAGPSQDGFHGDVAGIKKTVAECGTGDLVRWVGYLPDEDLRHLHSGAVALMLVSASEGFGLPAVEAARCGAPVIATIESPLPNILSGGGVFVPPGSAPAITRAIELLLTDEPARLAMGAKALERASALSWTHSARVALDALEATAAPRRKVA